MFYIYLKDGWSNKILTLEQAQERIKIDNPGIILPKDINIEILNYFNIEQLNIIADTTNILDSEMFIYTSKSLSQPYEIDGKWYAQSIYTIDNLKMQAHWEEIRKKRNALLLESDWIINSDIVTQKTKNKFKLYQQLLRDCVNVVDYPHLVMLPKIPEIIYINELSNNNHISLKLTKQQENEIKDYVPTSLQSADWLLFLNAWRDSKFNKTKSFVLNLIEMHTDIKFKFNSN